MWRRSADPIESETVFVVVAVKELATIGEVAADLGGYAGL